MTGPDQRALGAPPLIVVTGLPRSGTSMAMRMLGAGGVELIVDGERPPDAGNPHGYFEHADTRRLHEDASWLARHPGRAVKIVLPLLTWVPTGLRCDVLWMRRSLAEVLASQRELLARRGEPASAAEDRPLAAAYVRAEGEALRWARERSGVRVLELAAAEVVRAPETAAEQVSCFLARGLDRRAMADSVDPGLLRTRTREVAGS